MWQLGGSAVSVLQSMLQAVFQSYMQGGLQVISLLRAMAQAAQEATGAPSQEVHEIRLDGGFWAA